MMGDPRCIVPTDSLMHTMYTTKRAPYSSLTNTHTL
jgi:hypothetical protein